jgi:hypothetical protein
MKKSNLSVSELLNVVVDFFDTIDGCKELASCKFGYGFIARSTPNFRAPKATSREWFGLFGKEMPAIIKITKVTNAKAYDYAKAINRQLDRQGSNAEFKSDAMSGYEWIVPNIIKRATESGSLQLCVTFKNSDKTKFESFYIVADNTPHFATSAELDFIKSHLYEAPSKSVKQSGLGIAEDDILMVRNYKFSNIIAIDKTPRIEKLWKMVE